LVESFGYNLNLAPRKHHKELIKLAARVWKNPTKVAIQVQSMMVENYLCGRGNSQFSVFSFQFSVRFCGTTQSQQMAFLLIFRSVCLPGQLHVEICAPPVDFVWRLEPRKTSGLQEDMNSKWRGERERLSLWIWLWGDSWFAAQIKSEGDAYK